MNDRSTFLPISLNEGLMFGMILSAIYLGVNLLGMHTNLILNLIVTVLAIALYFVCGFRAMVKYRASEDPNELTFGNAFLAAFVAILIAAILYSGVSYAYTFHINPGAIDEVIDATVDMMEWMETPDEVIDEQVANMEDAMKNPTKFIRSGAVGAVVFAALGGLIAGLARKRRTPNA